MVEIKTPGEVQAMREAGRVVGRALEEVRKHAAAGVSLLELDEVAAQVMAEAGARPAFLHYQPHFAPTPFPAVICTSVNDAIVHGIPTRRRLADGDLLSVDCGVYLDGWAGDAAISFSIGAGSPGDAALIEAGERALEAAIAAMVPGGRLGDVGAAIEQVAKAGGYGVPRDFGGHGIGRHMHEDPAVPNRGKAGRGMVLRPGLALAIEPMFVAGGDGRYTVDEDGWTLRALGGRRATHSEHSVAVTEDGPVILTLP
ncbi:type I methionyl aminopeptidase [Nonomuraea sp. NPDC050310]|uniref:type I methionyl aminopeptidase n=1 Tax=unclassified Nonomuraea TaxID=2593643 RepID=UPI0033EAD699